MPGQPLLHPLASSQTSSPPGGGRSLFKVLTARNALPRVASDSNSHPQYPQYGDLRHHFFQEAVQAWIHSTKSVSCAAVGPPYLGPIPQCQNSSFLVCVPSQVTEPKPQHRAWCRGILGDWRVTQEMWEDKTDDGRVGKRTGDGLGHTLSACVLRAHCVLGTVLGTGNQQ